MQSMQWLLNSRPTGPPAPTRIWIKNSGLDFVRLEWAFESKTHADDPINDADFDFKMAGSLPFWRSVVKRAETNNVAIGDAPFLAECCPLTEDTSSSCTGSIEPDPNQSWVGGDKRATIWQAKIEGLSPNSQYDFRVYGVSSAVRSNGYAEVRVSTIVAPPPPKQTTCIGRYKSSVQLEWVVSSSPEAPVQSCEVHYHSADIFYSLWQTAQVPLPDAEGSEDHDELTIWGFLLSDLAPGTCYAIRIRSRNAAGWSDFSETCKTSTLAAPSTPLEVLDIGVTSRSLLLEIHVPDPEGAPVVGCEVEFRRADSQGSVERSMAATRSPFGFPIWNAKIIGIPAATEFVFRVRALNVVGWGPYTTEPLKISSSPEHRYEDESTVAGNQDIDVEQPDESKQNSLVGACDIGDHPQEQLMPAKPLPCCSRPVRILCLDGGGIKGLNTVWMIKFLEAYLGEMVPWEQYDLIAGSSIGGIIATDIAMGLRSSSEELEQLIWALFRLLILPCKALDRAVRGFGISRSRLMDFAQLTCPRSIAYRIPFNEGIPCFVTTARCFKDGTTQLHLVRNYAQPEKMEVSRTVTQGSFGTWSVRDAKAATAAAPTYVESHCREDDPTDESYYIDGGLYAANPTHLAILEAKHLWPGRKIGAVHSFGVGSVGSILRGQRCSIADKDKNLVDQIMQLCQVTMDCDNGAIQVRQLLELMDPDASYVRLQTPPSDVDPFESDIDKLAWLKVDTHEFLDRGNLEAQFKQIRRDLEYDAEEVD